MYEIGLIFFNPINPVGFKSLLTPSAYGKKCGAASYNKTYLHEKETNVDGCTSNGFVVWNDSKRKERGSAATAT